MGPLLCLLHVPVHCQVTPLESGQELGAEPRAVIPPEREQDQALAVRTRLTVPPLVVAASPAHPNSPPAVSSQGLRLEREHLQPVPAHRLTHISKAGHSWVRFALLLLAFSGSPSVASPAHPGVLFQRFLIHPHVNQHLGVERMPAPSHPHPAEEEREEDMLSGTFLHLGRRKTARVVRKAFGRGGR